MYTEFQYWNVMYDVPWAWVGDNSVMRTRPEYYVYKSLGRKKLVQNIFSLELKQSGMCLPFYTTP